MESSIQVRVLDCEFWKKGQCIIQIPESEFKSLHMDDRKRLVKRKPECWIFVNTGTIKHVPGGDLTLFVSVSDSEKTTYSLDPNVKPEVDESYVCSPHLFRSCVELRIIFCEKCGKTKSV